MRLERASSNVMHEHCAESAKYMPYSAFKSSRKDNAQVVIEFRQFGNGSEKFSDFVVSLGWSDVEAIISTFADMGRVEAQQLQRAAKLGDAVGEFVKNSN
jgi:hypothetical protein